MNNQWQTESRKTLKGAKQCNDFFQTQAFADLSFPIKIPLSFAQCIDKSNPKDPLLRQVLPQQNNAHPGFSQQPLEDDQYAPVAGLIHKYTNRVLLIATRSCAIHCQYCFRQNFDYSAHDALSNWPAVIDYIKKNNQIDEVILSGGDPLTLSDEKLAEVVADIEQITHVKTLRIHSRSAVVIPARLTTELAKLLSNSRLSTVMVFHINHAQEITQAFTHNLSQFSGVRLLNQSVLLKGVNDNLETLKALSLALMDAGILPYYLNMLDQVRGSEHYWVETKRALEIHQGLQYSLSGYLVPRLVRDTGAKSKTWLF